MIINYTIHKFVVIFSTCLLMFIGCDKGNIHGETLAAGMWKVTEIQGIDTSSNSGFSDILSKHIAFNFCSKNMNNDWGTSKENYGDCWMLLSGLIDKQFTQDEYRFHIRSEESLEIKLLPDHSDRMLPDLTGPYTYHIDGHNLVLRYTGTEKPEMAGLEIHCWDWSPE